jgi:hypothetical protein
MSMLSASRCVSGQDNLPLVGGQHDILGYFGLRHSHGLHRCGWFAVSYFGRIEGTMKTSTAKTKISNTTAVWLFSVSFVVLFAIIWGHNLFTYGGARCWYGLRYSADPKVVHVEPRPENCDYDWSPVGKKGCHYDKQVTTVRTAKTTYGAPLISYDEGKTWDFVDGSGGKSTQPADTFAVQSVDVSWSRVED